MDPTTAIDIGKQALWMALLISGPLLVIGLTVGLFIGVIQAVTQIHEMTLTFIPKILAVVGVFLALLPWITITIMDYTTNLLNLIPTINR